MREILLSRVFGDTLVRYPLDRVTGMVGFELIPAAMQAETVSARESLRGEAFMDVLPGDDPWPARPVESLLQLKLVGDSYPGAFAQGHTMRNSGSVAAFVYESQKVTETTIITRLVREDGCRAEHHLA